MHKRAITVPLPRHYREFVSGEVRNESDISSRFDAHSSLLAGSIVPVIRWQLLVRLKNLPSSN